MQYECVRVSVCVHAPACALFMDLEMGFLSLMYVQKRDTKKKHLMSITGDVSAVRRRGVHISGEGE